jgi:uncharacterized protein
LTDQRTDQHTNQRGFFVFSSAHPMKLHRELNIGRNIVTALDDRRIDINGQRHTTSLLLFPQHLLTAWATSGFDALDAADFRPVIEQGSEILLFGTGRRQQFPPPALLRELMAAQIGIEVMDTGAACRTFNILVAEGRNVAAALLIEP